MKILRIDCSSQQFETLAEPGSLYWAGGRAFIARELLDRPISEPLDQKSPFLLVAGSLNGIGFSSMDRVSIGGRSPLTLGIKESNAGGKTASVLSNLGIKAVILTGAFSEWRVVCIRDDSIHFEDAGDLLGLGVYETAGRLLSRHGSNCAVLVIGQAGERQSLAAGVQTLDKDNHPTRICARGGLGALMGSKKIKAIVLIPGQKKNEQIANPRKLSLLRRLYNQTLLKDSFVQTLTTLGTASNTLVDNLVGALPTRNFSSGSFESAEQISGEIMYERITARHGNPSHACMAGCVIRCSNSYNDPSGSRLVSPLDFETIAMLGSNLGVDDLDLIAENNRVLNDLGLDSIELGAALGVAAEGGLWNFGDKHQLRGLVDEIRRGTEPGRLLADGAYRTGAALGVTRIPVVKRQAMAAYDPRVLRITGITYATSCQGADHTAGMTLRGGLKVTDPDEQLEFSRRLQIENAALDALGVCLFAGGGLKASPTFLQDLIDAVFGIQVGENFLTSLGQQVLAWEWEYNQKAGFTRADDRIPGWMVQEALPPTGSTFTVPDSVLDKMNP